MLDEKIKCWKFKMSCFKLKQHHKLLVNHNISTLRFCVHNINKINFPTTETEKENLNLLIDLYDKTVADLSKDVERVKMYMREMSGNEANENEV